MKTQKKNPQLEEGQWKGRAILWDKRIDLDELRRFQEAEVQQPAYVYQNHVGPPPGTPAANKSQ